MCGGDKATRRSVSARVIMRGGLCLKVWTKKPQVVSLSTAESELYASVKTGIRRAGDPERGKGLGDSMWAERSSVCFSDDFSG